MFLLSKRVLFALCRDTVATRRILVPGKHGEATTIVFTFASAIAGSIKM